MKKVYTVVYVRNVICDMNPFNKVLVTVHETIDGAINKANDHFKNAVKELPDYDNKEEEVSSDGFLLEKYDSNEYCLCDININLILK